MDLKRGKTISVGRLNYVVLDGSFGASVAVHSIVIKKVPWAVFGSF